MELIELDMPVVRDECGHWWNPGIPDFDEDATAWRAWLAEQGIEIQYRSLEDEPDNHPAYVSYFDNGDGDISAWNPPAPDGDDWHTFSIHDTEDGAVWVWARRSAAPTDGEA